MLQVKSEFQDFYKEAVQCKSLDRGTSLFKPTWVCRQNGQLCGPRTCPERPWLRDLMPKMEPKPEPEIGQTENVLIERCPEPGLEKPRPVRDREPTILNSEKSVGKEAAPRIVVREASRAHSRPHADHVVKALVSFVDKQTKTLQRWGLNFVYLERKRRPSILQFETQRGKNARFYVPLETTNEDIRSLAGSWFLSLRVHDENATINETGSPTPYSIALLPDE